MKKDKTMSQFSFVLVKQLIRFLAYFFVGYRHTNKYKIKKGEAVLVLSNHQTDIDSVLINISFNRLLRVVATDNIFKKGPFLFLLNKFGVIPKRKGKTDIAASYSMMKVLSSKQCLVLFPEGNRTYAEFQYYVSDAIIKLIKKGKPTLILFNLHGGNGTRPRFKHKVRHGKFYGTIKKVMKYEEYKDIPDDELLQIIMDNLKVYDSESGELYKSRTRAEYLERMFFVCPKCNSAQTLYSKKELIKCSNCGFEAEFTEDLHLKSHDESVNFTKLLDWYNYQKEWAKNLEIKEDEPIFVDENVKLYTVETRQRRKLLSKGRIILTKDHLQVGHMRFSLSKIEAASPVSGFKLLFTHLDKAYEVKGDLRFNPLKYMLLFNKLDTKMHKLGIDNYYTLEAEHS